MCKNCHVEQTESCKLPGLFLLSFRRRLFKWMLHMLLRTLVPGWWLVFADAGGRNTWTTQILTSIFTKLIKSHALNLQVLSGLSDIYHYSWNWLQAACSYKHLLHSALYPTHALAQNIFLNLFELNPCEKTVKNVSLWGKTGASQEH